MQRSILLYFSFSLMIFSNVYSQANSLDFDGVNDKVQTTYTGITGTNARSIEAWVMVPATATSLNGGIVTWGVNAAGQKWVFRIQSTNGTNGAIRIEVNGGYKVGVTNIRDGAWHHVALTWANDGSPDVMDSKLYVDGALEGTSAQLSEPINTASGTMMIGSNSNWSAGTSFLGRIDELRVWNDVRTQTEIQNNMCDIPVPVAEANLVAYYKFDQTTGTNIPDLKSGFNGTTQNMTNADWVGGTCVPMTYVSSVSSQASVTIVQDCETTAEVVGIEIVTTGSLSPIDLTQLIINTAGTTNLGEVSTIDVFYTGSVAGYSPINLFASGAPAGSVTFNGTQTLVEGSNYFWVVYNLITPTTIGNILNATCTSVTVDATSYAPGGLLGAGRDIGICNPSPGGVGVSGLTSWFVAGQDVYSDAGITPATNGDVVTQWNNTVANVNIPSITKNGGGNQTLQVNHWFYNFNDVINFTADNYIRTIPYDGVFDPATGASVFVSASKTALAFTHTSTGTSSPCGGNRCCTGFRGNSSNHSNSGLVYATPAVTSRANVIGNWGATGVGHSNSVNGLWATGGAATSYTGISNYTYNIGNFPGYNMTGKVAEVMTFNTNLTNNEVQRIQSYLAIKYGVTLSINGTSQDYISSTSNVTWDQSVNSGYAYDIAGLARDDASALSQLKSHSVHNTALIFDDIVTIAHGSNYYGPSNISLDRSFFVWGHDGDIAHNTNAIVNYPTDNGELIQTIFAREWKAQESGKIDEVVMKFDLSAVIGPGGAAGTNDLANLRLLVDEDGDYSIGATSYAPTSFDNVTGIAFFNHDFTSSTGSPMDQGNGFYFTLGSTNSVTTPLPVELANFNVENENCSNRVTWSTISEMESDYFIIERSYNMVNWESLTQIAAAGNSTVKIDYQYEDGNYSMNGNVYYRLIQVDRDGEAVFLQAYGIESFCRRNIDPEIYPNPVSSILNIESPAGGLIEMRDVFGRMVKTELIGEGVTMLNVQDLNSGAYFITFKLNTTKTFVRKFVKM